MARKLTIRRVGGLLPATCLVVLVLLASVFIWLSTAGLPGCALRRIEAAAAAKGIHLTLGQLKLSPANGLALRARRVVLYATEDKQLELARLERATTGVSFIALLGGKLQFTMAEFRGLEGDLPTDEGPPLELREATASARLSKGTEVHLTSAHALLQGIPIDIRGGFRLPERRELKKKEGGSRATSAPATSAPLFNLLAEIRPWSDEAGYLRRILVAQEWTPEERPYIELRLEALNKTQMNASIRIPRYDEGQFHIRDAHIDVAYHNNTLLLNNIRFKTIEPDSEVQLQGGYDIPDRHLSFKLKSTAAITRMAEAIQLPGSDQEPLLEPIRTWLRRFRHSDAAPPAIKLSGNINFEEDFTLKRLNLTGEVTLRDFSFGRTEVDDLLLSFFYEDGTFNIDRMLLNFPGGTLHASASASSQGGKGKANIQADMDIPQLLGLVSEFTPEPITLPEGLVLEGKVHLGLDALLDMPPFIAGARQLGQFLPTLHQLNLNLGVERASYEGYEAQKTLLSLALEHPDQPEGELLPRGLEQAALTLKAEELSLPQGEGKEALKLRYADMAFALDKLHFGLGEGGHKPSIGSVTGHVKLGSAGLPGISAQALELTIDSAKGIRPLEQNWRAILAEASLRLCTGAIHSAGTLLGALDSRISLNEQGHIDLTLVLDREGHSLTLDLHPRLSSEGLLELDQVSLELPAAGFAPLLKLAGVTITQIRIPDTLTLTGSLCYDTKAQYLRQAQATLDIPQLIRTPGDRNPVFKGEEIPLSLHAEASAEGKEDGLLLVDGRLDLTHKPGDPARERHLKLGFTVDTAGHVHLEGTNTIDVRVVDRLIDLADAHMIMRDFRTDGDTRLHVDINAVDIHFSDALRVTASCDVEMSDFGYQLGAYEVEKDAAGKPTGREKLRTDMGKTPFRSIEKMSAHVDVLYEDNEAGQMGACHVDISKADITYDNRPWLRQQGIKGGEARSRVQGAGVVIDIAEGFVELRKIHGRAYPAYAFGMFYDQLPVFMEDFILPRPGQVETEHCLFPIYGDCKRPMSGCIRLVAPRADFRFLGTSFPLSSFSGFIWLTDGAVLLDKLYAACWEGGINAAVNIDYSKKHTGFDGYATVRNINLKPLAASYGSKQETALCNGQIRFRTPSTRLDALQAYGEVHIVDGDLMNLSIFRPLGELIADLPGNLAALEEAARISKGNKPSWLTRQVGKVFTTAGNTLGKVGEQVGKITDNIPFANHFLRYDLQEVHSSFTIGQGKLTTQGMKALGYNLNVGMQMELDLDKLTLRGDFWPKISSVPTLILSPITFLSDFMIDIQVFGPIDDIDWKFGLNHRKEKAGEPCVSDKAANHKLTPRAERGNAKRKG